MCVWDLIQFVCLLMFWYRVKRQPIAKLFNFNLTVWHKTVWSSSKCWICTRKLLFNKETSFLAACLWYDHWSMSVVHNSQPNSLSHSSLFWLLRWLICLRRWAPFQHYSPRIYMWACLSTLVFAQMTSYICGDYSNLRAAPSTSPPLAAWSAQSSLAGPQLAGCSLCAASVIRSAWFLRPGMDKIWIPYWCCHITCRQSASLLFIQDTRADLMCMSVDSLLHRPLVIFHM